MVDSYYLYTVLVAEFFLKSYMMIWIAMAFISPFMVFLCWYAKGNGNIPVIILALIFMFITRQAFSFGFWYLDIRNSLELILWIIIEPLYRLEATGIKRAYITGYSQEAISLYQQLGAKNTIEMFVFERKKLK